jgi:hypothetical protein
MDLKNPPEVVRVGDIEPGDYVRIGTNLWLRVKRVRICGVSTAHYEVEFHELYYRVLFARDSKVLRQD